MVQSTFSSKIRKLRKDAGYTQEDVSRMLNIQRQTYSNYENATRTPPLEIIISLAELYQISVDELVRKPVSAEESSLFAPPDTYEAKFIAEFSSLPKDRQKEVIEFIRFKQQFSE